MRKFIFLIGSTDDFESLEALREVYFNNGLEHLNASVFEFEVPENLDRSLAFLTGCGIAFANDWCVDGTFFTLLEA